MTNALNLTPSDDNIDDIIERGEKRTWPGGIISKGEYTPTGELLRGRLEIPATGVVEIGTFAHGVYLQQGVKTSPKSLRRKEEGEFDPVTGRLINGEITDPDGKITIIGSGLPQKTPATKLEPPEQPEDPLAAFEPLFPAPGAPADTTPEPLAAEKPADPAGDLLAAVRAGSTPKPRANAFVAPAAPIFAPEPKPFTDVDGNKWDGVDQMTLIGHGRVERRDGTIDEGDFAHGDLIYGKRTFNVDEIHEGIFRNNNLCEGVERSKDGTLLVRVKMSEGHTYNGKGRKEYESGWAEVGDFIDKRLKNGKAIEPSGNIFEQGRIFEGEFDDSGRLFNGTITSPDGRKINIINGVEEDTQQREITDNEWAYFHSAFTRDNGQREPIKGIAENASYHEISEEDYNKNKAAIESGVARLTALIDALPEEINRRRIGELHISYKLMPSNAPGRFGRLIGRRAPEKDNSWREFEVKPGDTHLYIDPLRLPKDDGTITAEMIVFSKQFEYQRKAEEVVSSLHADLEVNFRLDYEHGFPKFKASIEKIEKIRKILVQLTQDEKDSLSTAGTVLLLSGQKPEDYADSRYNIIISCDSPLSEDAMVSEIRGKLRELDEKRRSAKGKPKSKPSAGIFSTTRGKIAGALAGLTIAAGGQDILYRVAKPAPVAPKPDDKPAEPPKPPKGEPKKAPEAPPVGKVDLSKIPVGGTVKFKTPEDGVKMGVLMKDGDGYIAVDKFDFDEADPTNRTVKRIQE